MAGLISKRSDASPYDRFRGRVMFPIHDRRGRVIGFGGRVLGDDGPKYLNSPETPLFHKGRELYGRWQALRRGGRLERLIVVEGYMDVVALAQNGLTNAVATLGTAATEDHLENLFRLTPEVVFCFDGDTAGRRAAWRALENTLPQMRDGRRASFMFLPEGEDPDSLVREQGPERFGALVAQAAAARVDHHAHLPDRLEPHLRRRLPVEDLVHHLDLRIVVASAQGAQLRQPALLRARRHRRRVRRQHAAVPAMQGRSALRGARSRR